jgi:hypothetical protein
MPFLQFALLRPDRETFGDNLLAGCAPALHGRGEQGLKPDEPFGIERVWLRQHPMPELANIRHEKFAQGVASGLTGAEAYRRVAGRSRER